MGEVLCAEAFNAFNFVRTDGGIGDGEDKEWEASNVEV
jgi:hypothetical protein